MECRQILANFISWVLSLVMIVFEVLSWMGMLFLCQKNMYVHVSETIYVGKYRLETKKGRSTDVYQIIFLGFYIYLFTRPYFIPVMRSRNYWRASSILSRLYILIATL